MRGISRLARCAVIGVLCAMTIGSAGCRRAVEPPAPAPITPPATPATPTTPTTESAPASPAVAPAALSNLDLKLERRWRGFSAPLCLTNAGDGSGRLFVAEQDGLVKVVSGDQVLDAPYLDLRKLVSSGGERGLLSVVFAPDFKRNGRLYVNYTDRSGDTNIVRYTAQNPASNRPTFTVREVLSVQQPYSNHNGGGMQFGPDRMLYIGMGDGGAGGDPQNRAQNRGELLGKMLRIDVGEAGTTPSNGRYSVPGDNPFVGDRGARPEIWSYGLRNPWRFSFDSEDGGLWIGDVGQNAWEEVDYAPPGSSGQNWGWDRWEGNHRYPAGSSASKTGYVFPVLDYSHDDGQSITGGYVYRGSRYPALRGTYLYADFLSGFIGGIRLESPDGTKLARPEKRVLAETATKPSSFGVGEDGELYLVDYEGAVWSVTGTAR